MSPFDIKAGDIIKLPMNDSSFEVLSICPMSFSLQDTLTEEIYHLSLSCCRFFVGGENNGKSY